MLDELKTYSFKVDPLTNAIRPEPEGRSDHCIDAIRYSLALLIRNKPVQGYFEHRAMLGANFKSVPNAEIPRHPDQVFTVIATTERMGSSVAALTCAYNPHTCVPLHLLSYDLCDVSTAMSEQWIDKTVWETRRWSDFLIGRHAPTLRVEEGSFGRGLMATAEGPILAQFEQGATVVDFEIIERKHLERWPRLEHRTDEIRSAVNSGLFVRLTEYASQLSITHRTTTNNFLLQQLLGYRPDDRDQAQGLVAALAVAVLITRPPY